MGMRGVTTLREVGVGLTGRTGIEAALRQGSSGVSVVVVATDRTYRGATTLPHRFVRP
jgi:hypothetical protein